MNEKNINKKKLFSHLSFIVKQNLKNIIIFISISFVLFLCFQIYNFYSFNKIQKNSIIFFKSQNLENLDSIEESLIGLGKESNFYGILSKLELISLDIQQQNNDNASLLYLELLDNKNIDNIYRSAIASKASYQFIDLNFEDLTKDYLKVIINFMTYIDDELKCWKKIRNIFETGDCTTLLFDSELFRDRKVLL